MNALLWTLQLLLAAHTLLGAVWKFSNPEQAAGALQALPHAVWLLLAVVEIAAAFGLAGPLLRKSWGRLVAPSALFITAEMLLFCAVHFLRGDGTLGSPAYWLVVAAIGGFIAYGRARLKPLA